MVVTRRQKQVAGNQSNQKKQKTQTKPKGKSKVSKPV